MSKIILGIDPGYDRCGVSVLDASQGIGNEKLIFSNCIETSKQDDYYKRMEQVLDEIENVIQIYKPNILAIENLFFNKNQKTATKISEIRGAIIYLALKYKLQIKEFTPLQIKVATTGAGRADKQAVYEILPKIIKIDKKIELDDEFDAIACAITCSAHIKNTKEI